MVLTAENYYSQEANELMDREVVDIRVVDNLLEATLR